MSLQANKLDPFQSRGTSPLPTQSPSIFVRCLLLITMNALFYVIGSQRCFADAKPSFTMVTVPFTAAQNEPLYTSHQLVTVGVRESNLSPAMPATFLFDTGSTHCAISASFAKRLSLPIHPLADQHGHPWVFKDSTAAGVTLPQLEIGSLQVRDVPINILPDQQITDVLGQPVDGILGSDIWRSFAVRLDFTHHQITFFPPQTTLLYSALLDVPASLSLPEMTRLGFGKAIVVPLLRDTYTYSALVSLTNKSKENAQILLIDTGSGLTAVSEPIAESLGLEPLVTGESVSIKSYNVNKTFSINRSWLSGLHCGDLNLENLLINSPSQYDSDFVPKLGVDILANYDILFDFPHLKMYLKPRTDLQSLTSHQYDAASPTQRRSWTQVPLYVLYPTTTNDFALAIPYDVTPNGLPLVQVRLDSATHTSPFLLRSSTSNIVISVALAKHLQLTLETPLDDAKKPLLVDGYPLHFARVPNIQIGGASAHGRIAVLPDVGLAPYVSYLSASGVVGAEFLFGRPLFMNPTTQTWMVLAGLHSEDLTSLGMADASVIDILDPDKDGIPAVTVQVQQGTVQSSDTMTLATGSPFTLLSAEFAKTLKLTPEPQKLKYGAGKDVTVFNQAHLTQISIGGVVLQDVLVAYPETTMPDGFYPRLGMNVISRLRLLVDAPGKKMYVKLAGNTKAGN